MGVGGREWVGVGMCVHCVCMHEHVCVSCCSCRHVCVWMHE